MEKYVEGSYVNKREAMQAIQSLKERGYEKDEILVVTKKEGRENFANRTDVSTASEYSISGDNEDERSFWEKIKDAFTMEEQEIKYSEEDPLYSYHEDLDNGNIIILVNEKKNLDEPFRVKPSTNDEDRGLSNSDEDSEFHNSMKTVIATGTGVDGASARRATTDDIEESKSNNNLPGRDGDVFHTDQLSSKAVDEVNHSLHLDEAVDPDTSDTTGAESTLHANPDVPMDEADVLDRSSLSSDKRFPEMVDPMDEEADHLNRK